MPGPEAGPVLASAKCALQLCELSFLSSKTFFDYGRVLFFWFWCHRPNPESHMYQGEATSFDEKLCLLTFYMPC